MTGNPALATQGRLPTGRWQAALVPACAGAAVAMALTVLHRATTRHRLVDLQVYRKGAWAFVHGRDLYGPGLPGPKLPYTYTPFSTVAFSPLEALPFRIAVVAHTFVSIAAMFVGIALVLRELDGRKRWTLPITAIASIVTIAAFWSEPVAQTLGFGQINLVLMGLVLVDLLALRGNRWCGCLIGIAAGIKLTPLLFVAYLLTTKRHRAAVTAMAAAAATVIAGWALMPGPSHTYFFRLVLNDRRIGAPGFVANQSLNGLWIRTRHGYGSSRLWWDVSVALVLPAGLWLAQRMYARFGEPHGLAVAAVTGLLVSPISWSHHWVWWLVPFLVLAWSAWMARSASIAFLALAWAIPFYAGPFWWIAHRNYRAVPPVGWQRPLADAYSLVALAALAAVGLWEWRATTVAKGAGRVWSLDAPAGRRGRHQDGGAAQAGART